MSKTIFLHIGTHKTGTTSIQCLLAKAEDTLKAQGLLYPTAGRPTGWGDADWGHHVLAWALRGKRGITDEVCWHQLRAEIDGWPGDRVVLSSEDFSPATVDQVARVRAHLAGYDVRVILYVRNPLGRLVSSYKQRVKMGKCTTSFAAYMRDAVAQVDYAAKIARWETGFGEGRVQVRLFDKLKREPGIAADFCGTIGVDYDTVAAFASRPRNVSPDDYTIKLMRWLNHGGGIFGVPRHRVLHRARRKLLRSGPWRRRIRSAGMQLRVAPLVSEAEVRWLREATGDMRHRFLTAHVAPEDHHFFEF